MLMRHLIIILFALVLIASPFAAHHAVGEVMGEHGSISSPVDHATPSQCEMGCEADLKTMCCSQAITHCSPTFNHNGVSIQTLPSLTVTAFFSKRYIQLAQLMFEADTPPPRV